MTPGLEREIVDRDGYGRNVAHLRALGVELPRIADLADPPSHLAAKAEEIAGVDPDRADARNLFRVHWHNGADRRSWSMFQSTSCCPTLSPACRRGSSWHWATDSR